MLEMNNLKFKKWSHFSPETKKKIVEISRFMNLWQNLKSSWEMWIFSWQKMALMNETERRDSLCRYLSWCSYFYTKLQLHFNTLYKDMP